MEDAYEAHGEDLDVAALYALLRLAMADQSEDGMAEHSRAAEILLEVCHKEPEVACTYCGKLLEITVVSASRPGLTETREFTSAGR